MNEFRQFIVDRFRRERTQAHEMGVGHEDSLPIEVEEDLVEGYKASEIEGTELVIWDRDWLEEIRRRNEVYNASVSESEDPRLDARG